MKTCPECKYERTIQDNLLFPEYECPSCGIIFEKDKAKQELAELEKQRENERKAKREKLKKEEERKRKEEEERLRLEEEDRKKKAEAERLQKLENEKIRKEEAEKQLQIEEEQKWQEEDERRQKEEQVKKRLKEEAAGLLKKRQEKIKQLAQANRDKIISQSVTDKGYQLFDMCPFAIAQTGKGLSIAGFGETKNKWQHGRCMQKNCRLWTMKIEENGDIYAQGCSLQFLGLSKDEIEKNFAFKNTAILEESYPLQDEEKDAEVKK